MTIASSPSQNPSPSTIASVPVNTPVMLTCGANHTVNKPTGRAVALILADGCDAVSFDRQVAGTRRPVTAEGRFVQRAGDRPVRHEPIRTRRSRSVRSQSPEHRVCRLLRCLPPGICRDNRHTRLLAWLGAALPDPTAAAAGRRTERGGADRRDPADRRGSRPQRHRRAARRLHRGGELGGHREPARRRGRNAVDRSTRRSAQQEARPAGRARHRAARLDARGRHLVAGAADRWPRAAGRVVRPLPDRRGDPARGAGPRPPGGCDVGDLRERWASAAAWGSW